METLYKGIHVWTHREFKDELHKAFISQIEGKGPHSVLVLGDTGVGKSAIIKQFCAEMSQKMGLAKSPQKYGAERDYVDFSSGPNEDFESLLNDDPSTRFAVLKIGPGFIDYGDRMRCFENKTAIGVLILDFIYGLEYYSNKSPITRHALSGYEQSCIPLLVRNHRWEQTRIISDRVLVIATGIAADLKELPSEIGSDFYIKGFLKKSN